MQSAKQLLRQNTILESAKLSIEDRHKFESVVLKNLFPLIDAADSIAVYHAYGTEFSLDKVIEFCLHKGKKLFQPVAYRESRVMKLEAYNPAVKKIFSNPDYIPPFSIEWYNLDLILLPLVAVDDSGYRLGKGGGYYDTTLSNLPKSKPKLCGVGYSCQMLDIELPRESFDIRLDYFVSENGLTRF